MSGFVVAQFALDRAGAAFGDRLARNHWDVEVVGTTRIAVDALPLRRIDTSCGPVILIGEAHGDPTLRVDEDGAARGRALLDALWGGFIAVIFDRADRFLGVLRDPTGAVDCAVRRRPDRFVAANHVEALILASEQACAPAWDGVAGVLRDWNTLSSASLLEDTRTLPPGGWMDPAGRERQLWSPAHYVRTGRAVDAPRLRGVIDETVRSMARGRGPLLTEVSGGLDSAIMASSYRTTGWSEGSLWLNIFGPFAEADERAYAQAVADRLGVALTSVGRTADSVRSGLDLDHPRTLRPWPNRMDADYDRLQAALCEMHGLSGILTGKGGDVAFFQTPTSAIVADELRLRGAAALWSPTGWVLANRLRRSVWRVARAGIAQALRAPPLRPAVNPLLHPDVRGLPPSPHPWVRDLDGVPPAKRQQVAGFVSNLALHSPSRRSRQARLLHPALAQPVMEAVLATPTPELTGGGHDRLLARQAFADRLPPQLVARRSKGELGAYYGRVVGVNLDRLRPHLLEGRLAREGLIDREQVEAALQIERLIWQGGYVDLMMLALMESWAQAWRHEPAEGR